MGTNRRFVGAVGPEAVPALCVTVSVWPATVSVPTRLAAVLAAALKVTVAFPVPLAPLVIVSQAWLLAAVQPQLLPPPVTMTSVFELPPAAGTVRVVGEIPKVQADPLWVTETV